MGKKHVILQNKVLDDTNLEISIAYKKFRIDYSADYNYILIKKYTELLII